MQDLPEGTVDKTARVLELIESYRTRGHLMADTDPLNYRQRRHPDLDVLVARAHPVGPGPGVRRRRLRRPVRMKLRDVLGVLRDSYCRTVGTEYMHIPTPSSGAGSRSGSRCRTRSRTVAEQKYILSKLNAAEAFETFLQTKYVGQKRFSLEGGETVIPLLDAVLDYAAAETRWTRSSSACRTAAG